jgi:hypothetical protein
MTGWEYNSPSDIKTSNAMEIRMLFRSFVLLAFIQAIACGQESNLERLQQTQDAIAKIQGEVESLGKHPWAGLYQSSGGTDTGLKLWLAPKSGVAYKEYGNAGISDSNHGSISVNGANVHVTWALESQSAMHALYPNVEKDLVIVPWDDLVFVVPRSLIHRFCLDAKERSKTLPFFMALARGDRTKSELQGEPVLPDDLKVFLDLPEIKGKVTEVKKATEEQIVLPDDRKVRVFKQNVTLDVGANDHLFVGMKFDCVKDSNLQLKITEVFEKTSKAELVEVRNTKPAKLQIKPGTEVRTARW